MTGVQTCALPICFPVTIPRPATIAPNSITKRTKTPIGHVLGLVNAYVLVVEAETNIPDVIINSTIDPAVNDAGSYRLS